MIFCMFASGFAEGMSLITLMPLLQIFMDGGGASDSAALRIINNFLQLFSLKPTLDVLLIMVVLGIVFKALFLFTANIVTGYTVAYVTSDLRLTLIDVLMMAKWSYFINQPTGYFSNAVSSEIGRVAAAYQHVALLFAYIIQIIMYFIAAMVLSWEISLLALIVGFTMLILLKGVINMSRRAGNSQTHLMKSLNARLTDAIYGIKPIKAMGLQHKFKPLLDDDIRSIKQAEQHQTVATASMQAIQEPILVIVISIGLYYSVTYWNQPFSGLLVMAFLFYRLSGKIFNSQICYQEIVVQESALWSLDKSINLARKNAEDLSGELVPKLTKGIYFKNVSFGYSEKLVLNNVSLEVALGRITAVYGPSGAGKTTIADLIIGLQHPNNGIVCIDDAPISKVNLEMWRKQIGYVPQEMFLFHDTLGNNITLRDPTISSIDVEQAISMAGAKEFVASLPEGLDTIIGERGAVLSGGQRQRISIARALARKPSLLVLDEVTTSLDPKTEKEICSTLKELKNVLTVLVISHQTALIEIADVVYKLSHDGIHLE